jgi:hypothetical protein
LAKLFLNCIDNRATSIGEDFWAVSEAAVTLRGFAEEAAKWFGETANFKFTNYDEFKGLCAVLRDSIVQLSMAVSSQENKGDKMHMLYDFLTSNTFRMQIEAIVEGFTQMKSDLESEKRSMQRIWKQRDKQIEKVVANTIDMHGSIKGIAGNAIQAVKALELPEPNDLDED